MRASHREIRKKILDRMSKIDDKEFFTSRAYRGYLADITESATNVPPADPRQSVCR